MLESEWTGGDLITDSTITGGSMIKHFPRAVDVCVALLCSVAGAFVGSSTAAVQVSGAERARQQLAADRIIVRAGGRAGGRIEIRGTGKRWSFWSKGNSPFVILRINLNGNPRLPKVRNTDGAFALFLGGSQCRQQQRRKDRDDGDDHQQFNQRKGADDCWRQTPTGLPDKHWF